ncbi:MAG TPA: sigma-70 family RNA polymerase sigma factor [Magnetovibrio sp.]
MHDDEQQWSQWMAQAQDGDGAAYQRLLGAIVPRLRAIVGKRVRDPDVAEDVVQEILLSVHKNRHTYDPALPFGPWLGTIAQRRTMDWLRQHYRRGGQEVLVDEYPETFSADEANNVEDAALAFDDADRLHRALSTLPSGQRQAVELLKLKELSLKEASAASGMSIAALKVAMHRALKSLRADMTEETEP